MKTKWLPRATLALCLLTFAGAAPSQSTTSSAVASQEGSGIPIARLIMAVSKTTGKKFLLDPRVQASVTLLGQDPATVDYAELLTILQIHGFVAVEVGGYVRVLPDANARQVPVPLISDSDTRPDAEIVSTIIHLQSAPAHQLVPILRPLLPQYAHLAALPCKNALILVDSFANVRRLEALIRALDTGDRYNPGKCAPPEGPTQVPHESAPPAPRATPPRES